jgi:trimethylamine--corrinoid protein Co-methyltransferase
VSIAPARERARERRGSVEVHFEVLTPRQIQEVHEASVKVLSKTGMKFGSPSLIQGLKEAGAHVEESSGVVRLCPKLVEEAIESNKRLIQEGHRLHLLNGVTSEKTPGTALSAKISGGCEHYLDWESQDLHGASAEMLLEYVRLGEMLPEVDFVGNPIVLKTDLEGREIEEPMRRIKTAALVAKNTQKLGSMEVWSPDEIDPMVQIGIVARGGEKEYWDNPCLVTAKETISPLFLDAAAGEVLLEFARRSLPCTVVPMPISGMSAPVSAFGNIIVGNAEILGVMTAIKSVCPQALVGGGTICGALDMKTATASFSAPEVILQDIAIAEVHEKLYGSNYLIGSGYTDAKYPNSQTLSEKTLKFLFTYLSGRRTYPIGLINAGSVFSAEQALVDLEICRSIHAHFADMQESSTTEELVELIAKAGIGGNHMATDHTLTHFRESYLPLISDRSAFVSVEDSRGKDIYAQAHRRLNDMLSAGEFWEIDRDRAEEIDSIVATAEKIP